ncbi:MAG: hypothetical protein WAK91_15505 [Candidatus Acidiferrales bacterium]|jgi:hypothetical protein
MTSDEKENASEGYTAIILVIVLIGVAGYILFYGLQTLIYFDVKHWGAREASLYVTAQPLTITAPPAAPGQTTHLEFFNYQCEAPWKGPAKMTQGDDYIEDKFPSGQTMRIELPEVQADVLKSFKGESADQQQNIARVFGDHPFDSNFDLFAAIYNASPSQASPFMPRIDAERLNTLLIWKLSLDTELPGGTYQFESDRIRGLQFGNPERSQNIAMRAFNEHDRQFKMLIMCSAASGAKLRQADINQIIATLKPIPLPGQ